MIGAAVISDCETYRYRLTREWADGPTVTWVMLNPSTATATASDPTLGRITTFSQAWGFGGLTVANLFALRSPKPEHLMCVEDPVGPDNDDWIIKAVEEASCVMLAWGANGYLLRRDERVRALVDQHHDGKPYCLGRTKSGQPRHPLYLPAATTPVAA